MSPVHLHGAQHELLTERSCSRSLWNTKLNPLSTFTVKEAESAGHSESTDQYKLASCGCSTSTDAELMRLAELEDLYIYILCRLVKPSSTFIVKEAESADHAESTDQYELYLQYVDKCWTHHHLDRCWTVVAVRRLSWSLWNTKLGRHRRSLPRKQSAGHSESTYQYELWLQYVDRRWTSELVEHQGLYILLYTTSYVG